MPRDLGAGDVLLGLGSNGLHSNGFSLVRRLVDDNGLSLDAPAPFDETKSLGAALLESWNLPGNLWEPVRFQQHPDDAVRYIAETRILHLAIKITDCVEPELKTDQTLDYKVLDDTELNGIQLTAEELCIAATAANFECFDVLILINPKAAMIF